MFTFFSGSARQERFLLFCASHKQILLCSKTWELIKERLAELGAVDSNGLDVKKLSWKVRAGNFKWLHRNRCVTTSSSKSEERCFVAHQADCSMSCTLIVRSLKSPSSSEALALDMGSFRQVQDPTSPNKAAVAWPTGPSAKANKVGGAPGAEPGANAVHQATPVAAPGDASTAQAVSPVAGNPQGTGVVAHGPPGVAGVGGMRPPRTLNRVDTKAWKAVEVGSTASGGVSRSSADGGPALHLYQLLPQSLVGRAQVFGNKLALGSSWVCLSPPYFYAPGRALHGPGLRGALGTGACEAVVCTAAGHAADAVSAERTLL